MDVFAAVADPIRRDLLQRLASGPARVVDLAGHHDVSRPAISRHLRVLGDAGLIAAEDRGRERHYRLERTGLAPVTAWLSGLEPRPRFGASDFDGLELEVRRTVAERAPARRARARSGDRRRTTETTTTEETA